MSAAPHLFVIAGEPSGDKLGAAMMAGLKKLAPGVRFSGIGGPLMVEQGLTSRFEMSELSVMGIAEVLPRLPKLMRMVRETADAVVALRPDALITIDAPDFTLRVAARARAAMPDLKTIHYVAPTVWAWRPERAAKMARHVDHVLALFPFEPPYMQAEGMTCDFVGHPVVADPLPDAAAIAAFRGDLGIAPDRQILVVLPGSRQGEVARMEPVFADVAARLFAARPDLQLVIPAAANVAERLAGLVARWPGRPLLLDPRKGGAGASEDRKRLAFAAGDLALAASGTVSLELAAMGTPMVIAHRFNWLTTRIIKKKVKLKSATLLNILTDSLDIPEFLFERCRADLIAPYVLDLLADKDKRQQQIAVENRVLDMLGRGDEAPGMRAARSVLAAL
ncbi:MAG: lipid-A-disaccharide synthase [Rhodobacteraceae bacterium]|nr:lipid-A-disaccharide synthase [Paracoccaceae bacterium]